MAKGRGAGAGSSASKVNKKQKAKAKQAPKLSGSTRTVKQQVQRHIDKELKGWSAGDLSVKVQGKTG